MPQPTGKGIHKRTHETYYTCNQCSGKTWAPVNPILYAVVSVVLLILFTGIGIGVVVREGDPVGLGVIVLGVIAAIILKKANAENKTHWKTYWTWARDHGDRNH